MLPYQIGTGRDGRAKAPASRGTMGRRVQTKNALALLTLLTLFVGCSEGPRDDAAERETPLVLGFSQVVAEANWDTANAASIRDAARDAGIELRLEDARRSQENQVAALRSFIEQPVDVIAFSPVVQSGWEAVLRE